MSTASRHPGPAFIQDQGADPDLYVVDRALHAELRRRLPPDVAVTMAPRFEALGKATAGEFLTLADEAEAEPPRHIPYDAWGRRVDVIQTSTAWSTLKDRAAEHGLVACGYDTRLGEHRRLAQAVLMHLFSASTATAMCPLAMTDAAAKVLTASAAPALRDRLVPRLTSTDPRQFITSGQWMTERTGGSDVGLTSTTARLVDGGHPEGPLYALSGVKWFTSATTSEMALALARVEGDDGSVVDGSRGLSLFCVDVVRGADGLQGIRVNRMKDKLGTRALPTAELTLEGVKARLVGPVGKGVKTVAAMLNVTRFYNAVAAASAMAQAVFRARAYAWQRHVFGAPLATQPLHVETLDDCEADAAGALALVLDVAMLLGKSEAGTASADEEQRLRALLPLAKLTTAKQAVACVSEVLECFGGAGYVEDTRLPRMLRDAQVLPIWEGTTNVLSLDVLRAEQTGGAFSAVLIDLVTRAGRLDAALPAAARKTLQATVAALQEAATAAVTATDAHTLQRMARRLSWTTGLCLEAVLLADVAVASGKDDAVHRFACFVRHRLGGLLG